MPLLTIFNETRDTQVADKIELADTSLRRMVGLLGKDRLAPEEGLWIKPSSGVHTIGMHFPIDVVGLGKSLRIVKLWSHLAPYRLTALHWKVRSVIELPAGSIAINGLQLGDQLTVRPSPLEVNLP
jgi:uncharacterized membrane protein (UPF0127 family)